MKKIILIAGLMLSFAGWSIAQTTPAKPATKKDKAVKATAKTTTPPAKTAAPAPKAPAPAAKTTTAPAKPATAAGPTKKDGTPDMRYKANKDAAKTPPVHLKKDGTPDKRYKENKDPKKP